MESDVCRLATRRLVENVNLLWALNETPEVPKVCDLQHDGTDAHRQLTLSRERQLASIIAFISAYSEDNRTVMAVTIEERAREESMTVRLATNSGDLAFVKGHLERIAAHLTNATHRGQSIASLLEMIELTCPDIPRVDLVKEVHSQIIQLAHIRIKSRLRSKHSPEDRKKFRKGAPKPSFIESLASHVDRLPANTQGMSPTGVADLKVRCEALQNTFRALEAIESTEAESESVMALLVKMTRQAFDMDANFDLAIALRKAHGLKPSLKDHLPVAIKKLGMYYSIGKDLVDAARSTRYTIFNHITVETLDPPTSNIDSFGDIASFEAVIGRMQHGEVLPSAKLDQVKEKYESRRLEKPSGWKVHAEIQLLLHYESTSTRLAPRIICSSKSACYLCHLFVELHGRFQVSRTHGRVYEKWALPSSVRAGSTVFSLMEDVSDRVAEKVAEFTSPSWLEQSRVCTHPPESVAESFSSFDSVSTISVQEKPFSGTGMMQLLKKSVRLTRRLQQALLWMVPR